MFQFHLPDIGEGVVEGEIVSWKVKVGDVVKLDQPIVEVMTDKATVEIPSPRAGRIAKINYTDGQICPVGQVLVEIEEDGAGASTSTSTSTSTTGGGNGHGAKPSAPTAAPAGPVFDRVEVIDVGANRGRVLATPATRRMARQLGVELGRVPPTGKHGRVTSDDVKRFATTGLAEAATTAPLAVRAAPHQPVAIARTDAEERIPFRGIRKR